MVEGWLAQGASLPGGTPAPPWLQQVAYVLMLFVGAWLVHRLSERMARMLAHMGRQPERLEVIVGVISDLISVLSFAIAALLALASAEAVQADDIIWMVGLLSAGFGLAARPLISDYFSGLSFVFGNRFAVGEKLGLVGLPGGAVEGVVERVNLTNLHLRAHSGELVVVPTGEIRVIHNYSRGLFSTANVRLRVAAVDLTRTLEALEAFREQAVVRIEDLIEPWEVISETGEIGDDTVLTLLIKARYGQAATLRPRILAFLQKRLEEAKIDLVD